MLEVTELRAGYLPGVEILSGLSLSAAENAVTLIIGPNGAGKSTLLRTIFGLLPPRAGRVALRGADVTGAGPSRLKAAGVSYITQDINSFPLLTVEENLLMGAKRVPEAVLGMFPVLKQMFGRRGGDLSGGQQQQLAIGRALAMRPRLLILDEPTEGIQPSIIKEIERAIRTLAATGEMAILLVEQYYDFARSLADQYLVMQRGALVARGAGADMERDGVKRLLAV